MRSFCMAERESKIVWVVLGFVLLICIPGTGLKVGDRMDLPPFDVIWNSFRTGRSVEVPWVWGENSICFLQFSQPITISVQSDDKSTAYLIESVNYQTGWEGQAFTLDSIGPVLERAIAGHGSEDLHDFTLWIRADQRASWKRVSDLLSALEYLRYHKVRFPVAGEGWHKSNSGFLNLFFLPFDDEGYYAYRKDSFEFPEINREDLIPGSLSKRPIGAVDASRIIDEEGEPLDLTMKSLAIYPGSKQEKKWGGAIYLHLQGNKQIQIGEKLVSMAQFEELIPDLQGASGDSLPFVFTADPAAEWNEVASLMATFRNTHVKRFIFYTIDQERYIEYLQGRIGGE